MRLVKSLGRVRRAAKGAVALVPAAMPSPKGRLIELADVRNNPGKLRGFYYVPEGLQSPAPLVVVLHGCTQSAAGYDNGSGWSQLADRHGFALLFPEQQRSNNPNLCFNWFQVSDTQRGMGEAASIASMIDATRKRYAIDPARIFVTGLSAGGAMTSVMLATYPDLFAAGAIIAGVPYGCASGVAEAFDCMGGRGQTDTASLAEGIRRASPHKGAWPRVSVWQGSSDTTVVPRNAEAIVTQWASVHDLPREPNATDRVQGYPRQRWTAPDGTVLIEHYAITGMAHGTPLMPGTGEGESGEPAAFMLDAQISSTDHIAAFFGIAPVPLERRIDEGAKAKLAPAAGIPASVQKTIEDALKSAGLLR